MDTNLYVLEHLARERLDAARAEAARRRALPPAPPRPGARVALGQALVALGRRVRGAGGRALPAHG